jgi:hypothetical protein
MDGYMRYTFRAQIPYFPSEDAILSSLDADIVKKTNLEGEFPVLEPIRK